ncbi:MAG: hypothetical protein AAB759_02770 [Patescibacteria group bacterium]
MNRFVDVLGWYGVLAVVGAYGLAAFAVIGPGSIWYLVLNLTGAIGLALEAMSKNDRPTVTLNIVWMTIALIGLGQAFVPR